MYEAKNIQVSEKTIQASPPSLICASNHQKWFKLRVLLANNARLESIILSNIWSGQNNSGIRRVSFSA